MARKLIWNLFVVSAITRSELKYGVTCSGAAEAQNRQALDSLLEDIVAAPFEGQAAKAYGPVRQATRERKRDALDKLIAAHAKALDAVLVTNNEAEFAGYPGLRVERVGGG